MIKVFSKMIISEKEPKQYFQGVVGTRIKLYTDEGVESSGICIAHFTGIDEEKVRSNPELYVVAESPEAGIYLILANSSRQVFVTGHSEYDRYDLDKEYKRDLAKGLNPDIPVNYYPDDDPTQEPILSWRSSSNCTYTNWLNLVYQDTPYDLNEMRPVEEDSYLIKNTLE